MSERKRLVHGKQFDYFVCDVHDWEFDESTIDDVCPVCRGEQMERERLIKLVHEETRHNGSTHYEGMNCYTCHILRIMREEQ